jgi:cytochrome c553
MHFSQTHNWDGSTPVPTDPAPNGNWLGAVGPNAFLLKMPANDLCLACHDGQTFAPDVLEVNQNAGAQTHGRSAGALNHLGTAPYETWKGHTLGTTDLPPGFDGGASLATTFTYSGGTTGLECTNCHTQHGRADAYRNLGPRSNARYIVSYKFSTTAGDFAAPCQNSTATTSPCDVRVNLASYTSNSGNAATFAPYYDAVNVFYGRNDAIDWTGANDVSNRIDAQCAFCHGNFHGGPGDATIQLPGFPGNEEFIRHPTSETTIGTMGGGHSSLTRYTTATTKVKTYATAGDFSDASPGCVSCHKAHGNQNPFGLVFLNRNSVAPDEQGGWATGQTPDPAGQYTQGYRNLCGQCHGQGNL